MKHIYNIMSKFVITTYNKELNYLNDVQQQIVAKKYDIAEHKLKEVTGWLKQRVI